jgi:hypothetical protein
MVHAALLLLLLLLLCYRLVMHGCERLLVLQLYGCTDLVGGTLGAFFCTSAFCTIWARGWLAGIGYRWMQSQRCTLFRWWLREIRIRCCLLLLLPPADGRAQVEVRVTQCNHAGWQSIVDY